MLGRGVGAGITGLIGGGIIWLITSRLLFAAAGFFGLFILALLIGGFGFPGGGRGGRSVYRDIGRGGGFGGFGGGGGLRWWWIRWRRRWQLWRRWRLGTLVVRPWRPCASCGTCSQHAPAPGGGSRWRCSSRSRPPSRPRRRGTSGEIRFVVETALEPGEVWAGLTPRERAIQTFSDLHIWNTELRNGVLIYVLLADRDVEIIADRGATGRIAQADWEGVCRVMETHFRAARFSEGALAGVAAVGGLLEKYFPADRGRNRDELPNQPALL